jgi:predicted GNAT family acetyltransferase
MADVQVVHDADALRYELLLGGDLVGTLAYRGAPGLRVLVHTDVHPRHEGEGLGSRLVGGALDDIRGSGLHVVPLCPFVASYIRRHPEYEDLVVDDDETRD